MTELWIWQCCDCDMKTWSIAPLGECQHCGGRLERVGMMHRTNPTATELVNFFKGLEKYLADQGEDLP